MVMMQKTILSWVIFVGMFFCAGLTHAQGQHVYQATYDKTERLILAQWAQANAIKKIPKDQLEAIVDYVYLYSFKHELDPLIVLSMVKVESGFHKGARSRVNAQGLMQVMPRWHRDKLQGRSAYHPKVSIEVGTQVLKDCIDKHKGHMKRAFACYSGGARQYQTKVQTHRREMTRALVLHRFQEEKPLSVAWERAPINTALPVQTVTKPQRVASNTDSRL